MNVRGDGIVGRDEVRDEHPAGRVEDDVGALQLQDPLHLRVPAVVTDHDPDPAERQVEDVQAEIAGLEEELLLVPQMHLSVPTDEAVGADEHGRVVELAPVGLGQPAADVDAALTRDLRPHRGRLAAEDGLHQLCDLVTGVEDVARIAELGQDEQLRPVVACPVNRLQSERSLLPSLSPVIARVWTRRR